jgi:hypothetical protein
MLLILSNNCFGLSGIFKFLLKRFAFIALLSVLTSGLKAQAPDLLSTTNFVLFTASGAFNSNGASTVVTGDVGTHVGAYTPPAVLIGNAYVASPETAQAAADVALAYSDLAGVTCNTVLTIPLGNGQILMPGNYCIGSAASLNADLILDAQGDPSAIFIFQIDGDLSTNTLSNIILLNGASFCNVYWQVNGAVSLGEGSTFLGTIIAAGAINLLEGASLFGRGLSTAGAISLANNIVTLPTGVPLNISVISANGSTSICEGDSLILSGNNGGVWNTGSTTPTITVYTTGDYFVTNFGGCGSDTSNHIFVTVYDRPFPPGLSFTPEENLVCDDVLISASLITPGSGGSGICTDEYRYSLNNGGTWTNWSTVLPSFNAEAGINIIQARRHCTSGNCQSDIIQEMWTVFESPTASILPATIPDFVCAGSNLLLNGNPSGGEGNYTHQWEDASNLNDATVQSPVFNSLILGEYTVTYTVTDGNGCSNTTTITFTVISKADAGPDLTACKLGGVVMDATGIGFWTPKQGNPGSVNIVDPLSPTTIINGFTIAGDYDFIWTRNECSDTARVEVSNTQIICPPDLTLNILTPLKCDTTITLIPPVVTGCENYNIIGPIINGILNQGLNMVTLDVSKIHSVVYRIFDPAGFLMDTCKQNIQIIDFPHPPLGCIPIHLSLDENCEGIINPLNVLTGYLGDEGEINLGCLDCFKINVKASNGTNLGYKVNGTYLGKTLDYHIINTKSGFNCWNTVLIEDKIAPTIECRNDTISCMAPLSDATLPIPSDNCFARIVKLDERYEKLDCDPIAIGRYVRTWKAVDDYGNESASCNDTVYLRRTDLTGLVFPDHETLSCSEGYATDSKGFPYPAPAVTGVPSLNGTELYPFQNSFICNGAITYNDQLILNTPCKKRIIRTWSITEWWCSTTVIYNMPFQIIDILDTIPPAIPTVADITVTTKTRSCDAYVILPALNITDNCTEVKLVVVNATLNGVPSGTVNGNGGLIKLSVGTHRIEYTAIDVCGNTSKMHYFITVKDDTSPLAICDQLNTVSLNSNGYAQVSAASVDDGSFDECGPVTLQIQRMEDPCGTGHNVGWHDAVSFCCEDAHKTRMVVLLVTDGGGNTNMCMVSVQVQDKIPPVLTCPPHMHIEDCTYTFDPLNADIYFGEASLSDNCPSTITVRQTLDDGRTNCGIGNVVRTFTGLVNGTVFSTCTQTITFSNNNPFDGFNTNHVIWPKDTTITGSCSPLDLLPESLPLGYGTPIIVEDACDLVGLTHKDEVYYFANNNACWKILRHWTIIDWCQIGSDGKYLTWTHEQEIKVVDNVAPVITSSTADRMVCTYDSQCAGGQMTQLIATAMDCTPDSMLQWSYIIYNTGVNPEVFYKAGIGNDVSGYYPVGKYRVAFTVLDRCGNVSTTGYNFEMRNCKTPTPVCKVGLSTSLTMMSDGSGGNVPLAMIEASFFDNKSYHPCGYPVKVSFSSDTTDVMRTFTCDSIGRRDIEMWVTDINGNAAFCTTFIDIQDSLNLCGNNRIAVQGTIMTENEVEVESVQVDINNGEGAPSYTNTDGQYIFEDLPSGNSYAFTPKKDGDDKNGISTLDVVMIQRHILGIQRIESPYRLIAADVNKSGNISAADLLELRKLILGVYDELPNSDSWRFVDAMYNFPVPSNPWIGIFPEQCALQQVMQDATVNFVAIKVGDVNGSAVGHQFRQDAFESRAAFGLILEDVRLTQGTKVRVPVSASDDARIYGLQLMLNNRWSSNVKIVPAAVSVKTNEVFTLSDNKTGLSISIPEGLNVKSGDVLFYIEVESTQKGVASDILSLNPAVRPEIYTEGLTEQNLRFEWRKETNQEFMISGVQPNPWKSQTFIDVIMPDNSIVTLKVKDASGRKVISRVEYLSKGANRIMLTSEELGTAGIYFYELKYEHTVHTGKMIMID